ncbi:MAG: site-specific integrase, partial [Actinomycetota bacterium]
AHDLVHRNVAALVQEVPAGRPGRPSKSLTLAQSRAILEHLRPDPFYPYFVVSLMTGARTEELRALTWSHTFLELDESTDPPTPPHINVWRSVRRGSDTKTKRSRRSLALPSHCVVVLGEHRSRQNEIRELAGERWVENDLVFSSSFGTEWDASNVRKDFRRALAGIPEIDPADWTPRELRHSFVSTLSDHGVPIEEIAKLVGHSSTSTTETVYRHQIRPVIQTGASAMDDIFRSE